MKKTRLVSDDWETGKGCPQTLVQCDSHSLDVQRCGHSSRLQYRTETGTFGKLRRTLLVLVAQQRGSLGRQAGWLAAVQKLFRFAEGPAGLGSKWAGWKVAGRNGSTVLLPWPRDLGDSSGRDGKPSRRVVGAVLLVVERREQGEDGGLCARSMIKGEGTLQWRFFSRRTMVTTTAASP